MVFVYDQTYQCISLFIFVEVLTTAQIEKWQIVEGTLSNQKKLCGCRKWENKEKQPKTCKYLDLALSLHRCKRCVRVPEKFRMTPQVHPFKQPDEAHGVHQQKNHDHCSVCLCLQLSEKPVSTCVDSLHLWWRKIVAQSWFWGDKRKSVLGLILASWSISHPISFDYSLLWAQKSIIDAMVDSQLSYLTLTAGSIAMVTISELHISLNNE